VANDQDHAYSQTRRLIGQGIRVLWQPLPLIGEIG